MKFWLLKYSKNASNKVHSSQITSLEELFLQIGVIILTKKEVSRWHILETTKTPKCLLSKIIKKV